MSWLLYARCRRSQLITSVHNTLLGSLKPKVDQAHILLFKCANMVAQTTCCFMVHRGGLPKLAKQLTIAHLHVAVELTSTYYHQLSYFTIELDQAT